MKCPHCLVSFFPDWFQIIFEKSNDPDDKRVWFLRHLECPNCHRTVVEIGVTATYGPAINYSLVYPKRISRLSLDPDIPPEFTNDYSEAYLVLQDSAKASAALSRRCLQNLLREKAGVQKADLSGEIQEVIDSHSLPSHIAENLDVVRNIGNFAAHPIKSKSSGEIVEVEPGEAEWNLEVLEELFDFYFVLPKKSQERRGRLNVKLMDAGKPPLKN